MHRMTYQNYEPLLYQVSIDDISNIIEMISNYDSNNIELYRIILNAYWPISKFTSSGIKKN